MERATLIALSLVCVLLLVGSIASFFMCNWWWAFVVGILPTGYDGNCALRSQRTNGGN